MYDPLKEYTNKDFEYLSGAELLLLFEEAKKSLLRIRNPDLRWKIRKDIGIIRNILKGFSANHNRCYK